MVMIDKSRLSLFAAVQPGALHEIMNRKEDNEGFWSRMLIVVVAKV